MKITKYGKTWRISNDDIVKLKQNRGTLKAFLFLLKTNLTVKLLQISVFFVKV